MIILSLNPQMIGFFEKTGVTPISKKITNKIVKKAVIPASVIFSKNVFFLIFLCVSLISFFKVDHVISSLIITKPLGLEYYHKKKYKEEITNGIFQDFEII